MKEFISISSSEIKEETWLTFVEIGQWAFKVAVSEGLYQYVTNEEVQSEKGSTSTMTELQISYFTVDCTCLATDKHKNGVLSNEDADIPIYSYISMLVPSSVGHSK